AVGTHVFNMNVAEPGTSDLVGVRIGDLIALEIVGRVESRAEMRIVDALQEIDATCNCVAVDVFLILVHQDDPCRTRSRRHFAETPDHFIAIGGRVGFPGAYLVAGWIERENANIGCVQRSCYGNGTLKTVKILVKRGIYRNLANGRADGRDLDALR